jgi:uncharacterized glyoxalase superfamily protein PhnB
VTDREQEQPTSPRGAGRQTAPRSMIDNRTMPPATVFPVLGYDDVPQAVAWLSSAFGFAERWHVGAHRAVLEIPGGAVMLGERERADRGPAPTAADSVMVRVADADAHCARARRAGARVIDGPRDFPYGERQYSALDLGGHKWTFTQSIADRIPEEWGGTSGPALSARREEAENSP